jgi:hypothetical protein
MRSSSGLAAGRRWLFACSTISAGSGTGAGSLALRARCRAGFGLRAGLDAARRAGAFRALVFVRAACFRRAALRGRAARRPPAFRRDATRRLPAGLAACLRGARRFFVVFRLALGARDVDREAARRRGRAGRRLRGLRAAMGLLPPGAVDLSSLSTG